MGEAEEVIYDETDEFQVEMDNAYAEDTNI